MQLKTVLNMSVMTVAAVAIARPVSAQPIPEIARNACIQRTAEEMVVATRDVEVTGGGPVDALKGTQTLFMLNRVTGQTANCQVNTIDGTVLSVQMTSQPPRPPQPGTPPVPAQSLNACIQRTAEEMVVPARDIEMVNVGPTDGLGVTTLSMRNRVTGQTANCRVNILTHTVISVQITSQPPRPPQSNNPPVPAESLNACTQRTAEEMVVATRDIEMVSAGPVDASGVRTLFMRNRLTGQTANCRVNTRTHTVLSVQASTLPGSQGRPLSPNDPIARNCQATIGRQIRASFINVQAVNFFQNTTRQYFVSNAQESIRGEGQFTQKSSSHRFRYDCLVNIRNGTIQRATHSVIR
jgi:hypothetical protein